MAVETEMLFQKMRDRVDVDEVPLLHQIAETRYEGNQQDALETAQKLVMLAPHKLLAVIEHAKVLDPPNREILACAGGIALANGIYEKGQWTREAGFVVAEAAFLSV